MTLEKNRRRALLSVAFVAALVVLCAVLAVLQYRWIGEITQAARERLRAGLQAGLNSLSRDFNSEMLSATRAVMPEAPAPSLDQLQQEIAERYLQAKKNGRTLQVFRHVALAARENGAAVLYSLDPERGVFEKAEWPAAWQPVRDRLEARIGGVGGGGPFPPQAGSGVVFDLPVFARPEGPGDGPPRRFGPGDRKGPGFGRREAAWVVFEVNLPYLRDVILPELLQRHLESSGSLDYQVEVIPRRHPEEPIYLSDPKAPRIGSSADARVGLFDVQFEQVMRRGPGIGIGMGMVLGRGPGAPGRGPGPPDGGRWEMLVRHRAGSLEAVVTRARWRNLAVAAGLLLLIVVTAGALVRFTRSTQTLAELQMNFVAGVSHELRTPLTVIHTAAYNLRGRTAHNPSQVERYGELIQQESGRLKDLVEQVLQFASASAGRVIHEREPVSVDSVIERTVASSKPALQAAHCVVEQNVESDLPVVLGDSLALQHALQNLVSNAIKYGARDDPWVGIFAAGSRDHGSAAVEIRVVDRGTGIPEDEQKHIFEPFFRGRRALQDQVHGTGLGLNLARKIVEAHGGTIRVKNGETKGTEFIVRIPAAPGDMG
jgi:signal transduction histidine kinase